MAQNTRSPRAGPPAFRRGSAGKGQGSLSPNCLRPTPDDPRNCDAMRPRVLTQLGARFALSRERPVSHTRARSRWSVRS